MTAGAADSAPERPDGFSLAMNYLPLAIILAGLALVLSLPFGLAGRFFLFFAWIYLFPPLVGRLVLTMAGESRGTFAMSDRGYRVWWVLTQLQMVFNRLPAFDEALRLVPGLYPLWIGLWGGRLSPFAFIGPGVVITDRHCVEVRRGALLGAKAALAGHMALRGADGRWQVVVAAPVVEEHAIMGGDAGLGPGARLLAGRMLPAGRRVAPFAVWPRNAKEAGQ